MKRLLIATSEILDAHINQAAEAALMDLADDNTVILYLWSNDKVVFIGKNQNAFLECDLDTLTKDGGVLARRITGGGAVYHDKGNLNYSFITGRKLYDENRQFDIVTTAVRSLGVDAQKSGRNDLTIDGKKFSGNAFFRGDRVGLHHGTLLINSNYTMIAKYLSASKIKLACKNVSSVAARVINLTEFNKDIDKTNISTALINAAAEEYGINPEIYSLDNLYILSGEKLTPTDTKIGESFKKWYGFFTDKTRLLGDNVFYDARIERRFDWGTSDIRLKLNKSVIESAKIYSDALDTGLIEKKERALVGQDIYNITNDDARDIIEEVIESQKQ